MPEMLDIVDENGIPTGRSVPRTVAHAEGLRHRTSHVWIVRRKNGAVQVLLQMRCAAKDSYPGCYDISSAGHIPAGAEFVGSALRELREELGGKELTIEELLTQPFFLTEQDNYRRVLNRRLAARRTILTPSLECGDTSLLIRMLEIDRGVSFLPWYAVENSVKEGRLIRLSVEDCYISLYRQIFSHKEKWRTREMDEFVRVAKLADE